MKTTISEHFLKFPTSMLYNPQLSDKAVRILLHIINRLNLVKLKRAERWDFYLTEISKSFEGIPGYSKNAIRGAIKELTTTGILQLVRGNENIPLDHYEVNTQILNGLFEDTAPESSSGGLPKTVADGSQIQEGTAPEIGSLNKRSNKLEKNRLEKNKLEKQETKISTESNVDMNNLPEYLQKAFDGYNKGTVAKATLDGMLKAYYDSLKETDQKQSNGVRQGSPIDSERPEPVKVETSEDFEKVFGSSN